MTSGKKPTLWQGLTMNKYLERYLTHLDVEKGYSKHTIKTYRLIIQDFLVFISMHRTRLKRAKKNDIGKYIILLREERGNSSKTIRLKIDALRSFFNFLTDQVKLFRHNPIPIKSFKYKTEKREAESISEEQIDALLKAVEKEMESVFDAFAAAVGKTVLMRKRLFALKRDSVIIKLLLSTGLRISEALNIKYSDIDFEDKTIRILGKGKKYRQVFFDLEEIEPEFIAYLRDWQKLDTDHEYIFVSIKSYDRLSVRGFQVLLKKYLKNAGLSQSVTPHTLRHTFATLSIEKGANIKAVSQILGHSNCKITIDTYTHLSNNHLRAVMQKCNPLSKEVIPLEERIEGRKKYLAYFERTG